MYCTGLPATMPQFDSIKKVILSRVHFYKYFPPGQSKFTIFVTCMPVAFSSSTQGKWCFHAFILTCHMSPEWGTSMPTVPQLLQKLGDPSIRCIGFFAVSRKVYQQKLGFMSHTAVCIGPIRYIKPEIWPIQMTRIAPTYRNWLKQNPFKCGKNVKQKEFVQGHFSSSEHLHISPSPIQSDVFTISMK